MSTADRFTESILLLLRFLFRKSGRIMFTHDVADYRGCAVKHSSVLTTGLRVLKKDGPGYPLGSLGKCSTISDSATRSTTWPASFLTLTTNVL